MAPGDHARYWQRLAGLLFGRPPFDRQVHVHALSTAADAFVAVSLAGSLFFSVSVDAARPRIVLYLVITMAPFALVAPVIGPLIDRVRGGNRLVLVVTCAVRTGLCLLMARDLLNRQPALLRRWLFQRVEPPADERDRPARRAGHARLVPATTM